MKSFKIPLLFFVFFFFAGSASLKEKDHPTFYGLRTYDKLKKQPEGKWKGYDLYAFWSMLEVLKDENVKPPEEVNYAN